MTALTVHIAAAAFVLIGGLFVWARVGDLLMRFIALGVLVFVAGLAVGEARWIAQTLGGEADPPQALMADGSDAVSLLRELVALDPALAAELETSARQAGAEGNPDGRLVESAMAMGSGLARRLMPRLLAASDESFHAMVLLLAEAGERLPVDPADCRVLIADGGREWFAELQEALPHWHQAAVASMLVVVRDARGKLPAQGPSARERRWAMQQVMQWMSGLEAAQMQGLTAMGFQGDGMPAGGSAWDPGPVCGVTRSLLRFIADQPAPVGGQLLRILAAEGWTGGPGT